MREYRGPVLFFWPLPAGGHCREKCLKECVPRRGHRAVCPLTNPRFFHSERFFFSSSPNGRTKRTSVVSRFTWKNLRRQGLCCLLAADFQAVARWVCDYARSVTGQRAVFELSVTTARSPYHPSFRILHREIRVVSGQDRAVTRRRDRSRSHCRWRKAVLQTVGRTFGQTFRVLDAPHRRLRHRRPRRPAPRRSDPRSLPQGRRHPARSRRRPQVGQPDRQDPRPKSASLKIRKELGLYANLRPIKASPVR